jgi:elongation factor P
VLKASNLKKGQIVKINGQPYQAKHIDVQTPSARGANTLYKVRLAAIPSGQKLDQTLKGNDVLEEMELERRPVSFLFRDKTFYTFMDSENYEQYTLGKAAIGSLIQWLDEGLEGITALLLNGEILAIELPASVVVEITETVPVIKGATVTNRNKPAVLKNGTKVQVPEHLAVGEKIRVNTDIGKYMSRAKE